MKKCNLKNIKSHPSQSLAKANASRDLQITFNQAEDALTIPTESRHDYKCGSATQSGRSMIEMLGVLAIIGVLSVGGITGYSKAMMKYRINKTIEQITLIAGNMRTFFKGNDGVYCLCGGDCSGDGCLVIKKAKIIPDEMLTLDSSGKITKITNQFGSGIKIDGPWIFFHDIPHEACIELASYNWKNANINYIGGSNQGGSIFSLKTPVDVDKAIEMCSDERITYFLVSIEEKGKFLDSCLYENGGCI